MTGPRKRYEHLKSQLQYAVHELPAGVLHGADNATAKQCTEWMADLVEFQVLCAALGERHDAFIEGCRWHFEHYPHYLGRRRHFVDYETYVAERGGPRRVPPAQPGT